MKETKTDQIKLERAEYGWILLPVNGSLALLDKLYVDNYEKMSEENKCFYADEDFDTALKHVLHVASDMNIAAEMDGNLISLAAVILPPPVAYTVDLKWSLWTTCEDDMWVAEDTGKPLLKEMEAAFLGEGAEVIIHTAPRKEIRFGTVTISEGKAFVKFYTEWDSPGCHIPDNFPDNEEWRKEFEEQIAEMLQEDYGYNGDYDSPIGAEIEKEVSADTFEDLMRGIDAVESELLAMEQEHSEMFQKFLSEETRQYIEFGSLKTRFGDQK